jgi:hypothetical protein
MSEAAVAEKKPETPEEANIRLMREKADIERKKATANVRVYEKVNLTDVRPWGEKNPMGARAFLIGLQHHEVLELLNKRIEEGKQKFAGPHGKDAELLFHRIWQTNPPDGWLYSEAYYKAVDANMTIRSILLPNGDVMGY